MARPVIPVRSHAMVLLSLLATTDALSIGLRPPSVPASAHRAHIAMRGTLPDHANVPRGLVSMNLFQNLAQMRDQRVAGISHINLAPGKCTLPLPEAVDLMKRWKEEIADDPDRFAERAASDSQCPTAGAGGSLGFVTRGKLSKQFDDIIFGHEPGRVYGPITTPAGVHLLFLHTCREPISAGEAMLGLPFTMSGDKAEEKKAAAGQ